MRNMKHMASLAIIGIAAHISSALSINQKARSEGHRVPADSTIEKKFFRAYGPGRNQKKRRKLVRQGAHKWARRKVK